MSDIEVTVFTEVERWIEVEVEEPEVIEVEIGSAGPTGPPGPPGSELVWDQTVPLSSWNIPHLFGRRPSVTLYMGDEEIDSDIYATTTAVTVVFPAPTTGQAILT